MCGVVLFGLGYCIVFGVLRFVVCVDLFDGRVLCCWCVLCSVNATCWIVLFVVVCVLLCCCLLI